MKGIFLWVIQGMGFCEHEVEYREKNYFLVVVKVSASSLSGGEIWLFNVFDERGQRKQGSENNIL